MIIQLLFAFLTCFPYVSSYSVFMIVGGTGDLAGKYLWDAIFREVYLKRKDDIKILTSGRSDDELGKDKLSKIMKNLRCNADDGEECEKNLKSFASSIKYVQLENDIQFAKFCRNAFENTVNITEVLWYLAIPPNFYPMVLMSVHSRCRFNNVPLKVALEKPFWRDSTERTILARIIQGKFTEHELYLVDHYLVKSTALIIGEFRKLNSHWYKIRNLDQIELVLLEREHVKDARLNFYDRYGVVRDVIQSHLNELLLLLVSEIDQDEVDSDDPDDLDYELSAKRSVLSRLRPFSRLSWINGQHNNYKVLTKSKSKTPTFASLKLKFDVAPQSGDTKERPVLIVAGKYMDSKRSYARLTFKLTNNFVKEVVFLMSAPAIFVSKDSLNVNVPETWTVAPSDDLCSKWLPRINTNLTCSNVVTLTTTETPITNVYRVVLHDFLNGNKKSFTNMDVLEESWKVWDHILRTFDEMDLTYYEKPEEVLDLIFVKKDGKIKQEL